MIIFAQTVNHFKSLLVFIPEDLVNTEVSHII